MKTQKSQLLSWKLFQNTTDSSSDSKLGLAGQVEKLRQGNQTLRISWEQEGQEFLNRFVNKPKHPSRRISVRD